jgi:hypothetical protein
MERKFRPLVNKKDVDILWNTHKEIYGISYTALLEYDYERDMIRYVLVNRPSVLRWTLMQLVARLKASRGVITHNSAEVFEDLDNGPMKCYVVVEL